MDKFGSPLSEWRLAEPGRDYDFVQMHGQKLDTVHGKEVFLGGTNIFITYSYS